MRDRCVSSSMWPYRKGRPYSRRCLLPIFFVLDIGIIDLVVIIVIVMAGSPGAEAASLSPPKRRVIDSHLHVWCGDAEAYRGNLARRRDHRTSEADRKHGALKSE